MELPTLQFGGSYLLPQNEQKFDLLNIILEFLSTMLLFFLQLVTCWKKTANNTLYEVNGIAGASAQVSLDGVFVNLSTFFF